MHMVRHQAVRMHGAAELPGKHLQIAKISGVVAIREEARIAIYPSLNDVQRKVSKDAARRTRHDAQTEAWSGPLTPK
jgi:hypothetical protein